MMNRWVFTALCLGVGCASAPLSGPNLSEVRVYPKGSLKVGKANFREMAGALVVKVDNRGGDRVIVGAASLTARDGDGGVPDLAGTSDGKETALESGEGAEVTVPVRWSWPTDDSGFLAVVERRMIEMQVEGTVVVSGAERSFKGPVAVPAPQLAEVAVRHVEATRDGALRDAELSFRVEVRNNNFFPINIESMSVSITVEGVTLVEDQVLSAGDRVRRQASIILEVPLLMNRETHGGKLRKLLRRGNLAYTMVGSIRYDGLQRPIELNGEIQFPEF
jgi:LEA14-like dessication related protein